MSLLLYPLLAFVSTTGLLILAQTLFPKIGLLDFPERYGLQRKRLPYPTGIIAVIVFTLFYAIVSTLDVQVIGVIIGYLTLALISFADDRYRIHPAVRLSIQICVAISIFASGTHIYTLTNPLEADGILSLDTVNIYMPPPFPTLPLYSGIFTIFWLLFTMNALNWFDGIPGQVSTLSTIGFLVIGALSLSHRVHQPDIALIAFLLAAIAGAGLLFDFPPHHVLMGDTGAMFFGLMLGVLTIYSGGKVATAFLVLGVPLIDVLFVVTRRIAKGKNPMKGNTTDEHLHHRLLQKGWSERNIIALTAGLGSLFGIAALFFSTTEKIIAALLLFLVMIGLSIYSATKPHSL